MATTKAKAAAKPTPAAPKTVAAKKAPAAKTVKASAKKVTVMAQEESLRDQAGNFASQAGAKMKDAATQGKDKASGALDELSGMVGDLAKTLDEKVGAQYGDYARKAASAVSSAAGSIKSKDVEELIDDARTFVREKPAISIGAAAAVGFVLTRLFKAGSDDDKA